MSRVRRFSAAMVVALLIAGGTTPGITRVEAAGKKGGSDGQGATCAYLLSVINYQYVSPAIKVWAVSLYNSLGCQPALP